MSVNAPSEDILGINAMLEDTDEDGDGKRKSGDEDSDVEPATRWSSEVLNINLQKVSSYSAISVEDNFTQNGYEKDLSQLSLSCPIFLFWYLDV